MFHLDATIFGSPTTDLSQTQADQFRRMPGDVGRGQFQAYNPTGAIPVSAKYSWTGAQLYAFRELWKNATGLNFGADWFTMDLPLMLNHEAEADLNLYPYSKDPNTDFVMAVTIGLSGTDAGFTVPISAELNYGTPSPYKMFGLQFAQSYFRNSINNLTLKFDSNVSGEGTGIAGNFTNIDVYFPDTDETATMIWRGSQKQYSTGTDLAPPLAQALWFASEGETKLVVFKVRTQAFQRYRVHMTGPYEPVLIGPDNWAVSFPVEVDTAPALVIPEVVP